MYASQKPDEMTLHPSRLALQGWKDRKFPILQSAIFFVSLALALALAMPTELRAQTLLTGPISSDTVLPADVYLLQGEVNVETDVTLTIDPGAILKAEQGARLTIDGTLQANATMDDPIVFTDERDDTAGGDTNGDGSASSPAPGWWQGLNIRNDGSAMLSYADIRYAGYGSFGGTRNLFISSTGNVTLSDSFIRSSSRSGIEINNSIGNHTITNTVVEDNANAGLALANAGGMLDISNNTFTNNPTGIDVAGTAAATQNTQIDSNTISGGDRGIRLADPDVAPTIQGNTIAGTSVAPLAVAGGTIDENAAWDADETYVIEGDVNVAAGVALTVPAGAVVKVRNGQRLSVSGDLNVPGTAGDPVVFTEYRDDSVGGDSNGDGSASSPAPGWWEGLNIRNDGSAMLSYADIRYAGYGSFGGTRNLFISSTGNVTLSDSFIRSSSRSGIEINNSIGNHTITNTVVEDNTNAGLALANAGGMLDISNNTFTNNPTGIDVAGTAAATQNTQIDSNTISGGDRGIRLADPDVAPTIQGNTIAATSVAPLAVAGGTIDENAAWDADETYVIEGDVNVAAGVALTVPAGAVVKARNGQRLSVSGDLNVPGTAGDPVVFTEYRDDSVGGDSNGDGSASSPAPGWWEGLNIRNDGSAMLSYADIRYAGYGSFGGTRNLFISSTGNVTLNDSFIRSSSRSGIEINNSIGNHTITNTVVEDNTNAGLALANAGGMLDISNNTFTNNPTGIDVAGTAAATQNTQIDSNTISGGDRGIRLADPDVAPTIQGNTIAATSVAPLAVAGGTIDENAAWDADETYVIEGDVNVAAGVALTVPAGAVVKARNGQRLSVSGDLNVPGTAGDPVVFTEYRDDSVGGDSNGDGSASSPAPGWWEGLNIRNDGSAMLSYADIRYAGYGSFGGTRNLFISSTGNVTLNDSFIRSSSRSGIEINNSIGNHTITNTVVEDNNGDGLALINADGAIDISGNVLEQNAANGLKIQESSPAVLDNEITDNGVAGVFVTGSAATPELFGNLIANNDIGVDATSDANPLIGGSLASGNDILGNTNFGVRNQSTETTVDARYNWWGDETGPQHPSLNPDGIGDEVSDNVLFDPWLGASALQPAANIAIEPALVDFHPQFPGNSSDAESVTVENRGTAPLNVGQLTLAGDHPGDFEILTDEVSETAIEPLESGAVDIRFTPTEIGSRSAVLEVPSDDPDNPLVEIELFGEGLSDEIFADDFDASL